MRYIIKIDGEVLAVAKDPVSARRFLRSILTRSAKIVLPLEEGQEFRLGRHRQDTKKIVSVTTKGR